MGRLLRATLPIAILIGGGALFFLLSSMRAAPQRVDRVDLGPLVQTLDDKAGTHQVIVWAQGAVRPDREIDLVSQVTGVVQWISPELESGGFFAAGELLARIDPEDYELSLQQVRAEVERNRYLLQLEHGEAEIARLEWDRVHPGVEADPLVLRIPQVRAAEATLRASEARQREGELRLERTQIRAPFHGRVRTASVDAGQYVGIGRAIARIYSIEKAEILVPISDEELAWIDVPSPLESPASVGTQDPEESETHPPVTITARYAGREHRWQGRVVRTEGELDPRSRMAHLVIEVSDPYRRVAALQSPQSATQASGSAARAQESDKHDAAPLMVGLFCDIEIRGRVLQNVIELPRGAIHASDQVWTVTPAGQLRIHNADVVRTSRDKGLVRLSLADGERVIVSQLKGVTHGMQVRIAGESAQEARR
ncbi:MAG: HlyD family efflux transporter periplasmic adaptor subunit [Gemmatimonadetes bacterium]|jgi:multidrug efflux pump subunit AcrA (membrane-fusion protein)|nr:HlyD family efflux transporter periplasmic adaptor subunit [Gemmatimonadota bacterium]MBT4613237.1 HlyD family efflux transporter periplasmic adaptor subunit [Gemmatimonadota bacterium]MBT5056604.1 HlyD family efflux transporter periplasmic adaptor subunit [Gemmatimonadota bacterium]MBT5145214.1 HlyD family efflux transporter periplasmic adaptor subunit [Gemmatimonadota bacterium]MBT5586989.1 HlyD family efflux transporter periplasmic adaptor subunit [Gemmatimonadota bacterium]